jgi:iron complex transport system ATP-binding protein
VLFNSIPATTCSQGASSLNTKGELLSVQQLSWQTNGKAILQDVSFTLTKHEIVAIIGPNGAGKTSLLRCITQQIQAYHGDIVFQDEPLNCLPRHAIAQKIAMVSQINDPVFQLSVFEVVRMGLIPHKGYFSLDSAADHQRIVNALRQTDLLTLADKYFHQLSGGEQQRTLIARALVQQAQLIILDEPTNHLDVYYQHQILSLISSLGLTVLLTIHDINLAAEYCQRLLILKQGKVVADGAPNQVLSANLLSLVFDMPCQIQTSQHSPKHSRVYFHRPNIHE